MSTDTVFDNLDLALSLSPEIKEIARPLKLHFDISSLVYARMYNDGSEIRLTNQPAWIQHYYDNSLYLNSGFEQAPSKLQSGYAVWSHLTHHRRVLDAAKSFNIDHGLSLIQKTPDGCELFFMGTTSDKPQVTNLMLNHLDFMHRFTFYFREQAASLLKRVDKHRIIIPNKFKRVISLEQGLPQRNDLADPQQAFRVKKYHLAPQLHLTARELECALLFAQGQSARMIAESLSLSSRTVETHLMHAREKLQWRSKADLIQKLKALSML